MLHNTPSKKLEPWLKAIRKKEETLSDRESLPFDLDEAWAKLEEALPAVPAKQVSAPKSRRHLTWHAWVGMAASFALVIGIAWSIWSSLEHQAIAPDQPLIAQQNSSAQSPQSPDFMEAPLSIPTTPNNQHHEKANDAVHYKEVYTENLDIKETLLPREEIAPDEASSSDEPSTPTPQRNMGPERDLSTPSYQDMRTPVYSDFTPQVRTGVFLCNNISSQSQRNTPNSFDGGGGMQLMSRSMNHSLLQTEIARAYDVASFRHFQPLHIGAKISIDLGRRTALESGLVYSYLRSTLNNYGSVDCKNLQHVHYIGIPLGFNFSLYKTARTRLYTGISGRVDKAISATLLEGSLGEEPWQMSLQGKVGASYDIVSHFGFFMEAGLAYYFNDESRLQTYYKQHPLILSFSAGIQFNY